MVRTFKICTLLPELLGVTKTRQMRWMGYVVCRSHGSSDSIVSDYRLDDWGLIPDRGRGFFF
jgi:hypothetical protein